jgi:hypothetical protein
MFVGVAAWRRRRTANTRDGETAVKGADADGAADDVGVAVVYNAGHRPEEAVAINLPAHQPRRTGRARCCPVRFPEGVV